MDCYAIEQVSAARPSLLNRMFDVSSLLFPRRTDPSSRLVLDEMPDRVKRDLGFLDGREPRYEDDRTR